MKSKATSWNLLSSAYYRLARTDRHREKLQSKANLLAKPSFQHQASSNQPQNDNLRTRMKLVTLSRGLLLLLATSEIAVASNWLSKAGQ